MKQELDGSVEPVVGAAARLARHCAIGRFVSRHPRLALHVVRLQGERQFWQALDDAHRLTLPEDFEREPDSQARRERHYSALLEAARGAELVWRERHGFQDFAYLLAAEPGERLFLVGLSCASAAHDYRSLEQAFSAVTGAAPQILNAEFSQYVAAALARPVLTPALLREISDFCQLFRDFVRHDSPLAMPPPRASRPAAESGVVAVALAPVDAGRGGRDPLRVLIEARRLLHEAQSFAGAHEGAFAVPLEDYGVLLTLPVPAGSKSAPRPETARKLAEKLRQLAYTRLGSSTVAGTAIALAEPESREAVAQRAVLGLRMALESGQAVLLLEELSEGSKAVRHSHVQQALERLGSTFEREAMTEAAAMAHGFIQTVAAFSGGRLDLVRIEFVLAVTHVAKVIQRRHCLAADMPDRWGDEAALRFDACASFEELIDELKRSLNRVAVLVSSNDGPSYLRIEELLDYLRSNLAEPVKLPHLARRTGFSVPSFCRVFKRATGHSLLTYVRGLRIDRAKHLLATTELPNTSVAELSGFHSQHHFIRSFKKVMRSTPGEYRRSVTGNAGAGA
jgi:AraC-like DNA-binding protein